MTIFTSQRVNLDREPWVDDHGKRHATEEAWCDACGGCSTYLRPRPEFEPTRDPFPYVSALGARYAYPGTLGRERLVWAPRREEFDTPVNRVLEAFRAVGDASAEEWAYCLSLAYSGESWPVVDHWDALEEAVEIIGREGADEIDHARKVLTRLAGWSA